MRTEELNKIHFPQKAAVCKVNSFNDLNIESPFITSVCLIKKLRDFHWGNSRSKESSSGMVYKIENKDPENCMCLTFICKKQAEGEHVDSILCYVWCMQS